MHHFQAMRAQRVRGNLSCIEETLWNKVKLFDFPPLPAVITFMKQNQFIGTKKH